MSKTEVGGIPVWNEQITGEKIPGSTRIPVVEIMEYFNGETRGLVGLDLGSGKGRSTKVLEEFLVGSKIIALDLSFSGLTLTQAQDKIQAKAEELPFRENSFDFINVCGVMTNIVDEDPKIAKENRTLVLSNLYLALKAGGCVVISDFGALHLMDDYRVNYDRHALITGERGTIAVLKNGENFIGKSDEEVAALKGTDAIERYAHHYTPDELIDLLQAAGFNIRKYSIETVQTPVGNKTIENIIMLAEKAIEKKWVWGDEEEGLIKSGDENLDDGAGGKSFKSVFELLKNDEKLDKERLEKYFSSKK